MSQNTAGRCRYVMILGLLCAFSAGCRSESAQVSGWVTFDGERLKSGTITFHQRDANSPSGAWKEVAWTAIGENGTYVADDVPIGPTKVTVKYHPRVPPGFNRKTNKEKKHDATANEPAIPASYLDPDKSDLAVTIKGGDQAFNLQLRAQPKP